jgi:hypothetical protein
MLIAVSGNFGFLAPVLATESPQTIDAINRYPPEVALNAVALVGFVVGLLALGVAMAKTGTFPRQAATGTPPTLSTARETDPSALTSSRITDWSRRTAIRSIRNCRGAVLHI